MKINKTINEQQNMNTIKKLIFLAFTFSQLIVWGQKSTGTTQDITIIKAPTSIVAEAHPLLDNPKIEDTTKLYRKVDYCG